MERNINTDLIKCISISGVVFNIQTFRFIFGKTMACLYVVYFLFNLAFDTEKRLNAILTDTVAYCLAIAIIILVHKMNFLKILNGNETTNNSLSWGN